MSSDADQFFDTLNFVLHFLREEGFCRAEESLRQELSTRFEFSENQVSTSDTGDGGTSNQRADSPGSPECEEVGTDWSPPTPDPTVSCTPAPTAPAPAAPTAAAAAAAPIPAPAAAITVAPPAQAVPRFIVDTSNDDVDEYDSLDDPGYYRKEVLNQQRFIETELIMEDDEEGFHEHAEPSSVPHVPGSPSSVSSTGSLQYSSERAMSGGSPLSISASQARSQDDDDEAWELGPTDIRLVEPVTAPAQAPGDAPAPTLRRVESLSSSFKDDGETPDSCDNSFFDSEAEPADDVPCTIDLAPPASSSPVPELRGVFDSMPAAPSSRASSAEVQQAELKPEPQPEVQAERTPELKPEPQPEPQPQLKPQLKPQLPPQEPQPEVQLELQPEVPVDTSTADTAPIFGLSIQTSGARDETSAGGFSFPITPPTSEPDQLFSSWPSFRSPTSETSPDLAGASDDDGADADDERAASSKPYQPANGVAVPPSFLRPELTAHMISLSVEDEQGSERLGEAEGEEDDAVTSASPAVPPAIEEEEEEEPSEPAVVWEGGAAPRTFAPPEPIAPQYILDEDQRPIFVFNEEYILRKYETIALKVIHRRNRTGFEETKDFPIRINDLVAGRYQVMDTLGSAAFSRAVQALDIKTGALVCLKIIKNNKDYFDQSLDEIKLLHYVNTMDPNDENGVVRLFDYFYYKEHLFLVCELLRANLYEFQKFNRESGDPPYFTLGRIQKIAHQVLGSLAFLHSLGLIHSDLKPENILIKSYSNCEVKVIDLGSSCFTTDHLSSYVQSRSYRAPEVILGLPYDQKIDIWSLGCILSELSSGFVLFQNDSLATLLARLEGILGPVPTWMVHQSKYGPRFYTRSGMLYELNPTTKRYEILVPKKTSLRHRMPDADSQFCDFVKCLLAVDPNERPTAEQALQHPWLQHQYPLD